MGELATITHAGEAGWYVPPGMNWCPRCGDTNYDETRLCITCTHGDWAYRDGQFRNGWRTA